MTADALPFLGRRAVRGPSSRTAWLILAAAAAVLWILFRGQWTLPHQPDTPPAIDERQATLRQGSAGAARHGKVPRVVAGNGTAKHTK